MAKKMQQNVTKPVGVLRRHGKLRFFSAPQFTVVAVTPFGRFKLFKITFGRDGSIYIPFSYLNAKRGLLTEADPASEPAPKVLRLRNETSIVVDYDVKFSHHTSGIVQFSRTGQQALLPRRQGFRLDGPIGRVFDLDLHWLRGFETVDRKNPVKDALVELRFPERHPSSLHIWAEWLRKADVIDNIAPGLDEIGPLVSMTRRADGATKRALVLGQPKESPLQDHVLVVSAEEIPLADGADSPTAVFRGGWDHHEGDAPKTAKMLVFMYPFLGSVAADGPELGR